MFRISWPHLGVALLLFVVEACIAAFAHDHFVRPHVGDLLVVMLMFFAVRAITSFKSSHVALAVLLFAYAVELSQYFQLINVLGLDHNAAAKLILGNTFQWIDLVAYTCGVALALLADKWLTALLSSRTTTRTPNV